jgi:Mg-chelatase subunit ChlD
MKLFGNAIRIISLLALILSGICSCKGGDGTTWPGDPLYDGTQDIEEIEGADQVTFWITERGGSFDFPGGRMFIPEGAAPARRQYSVAKAPSENAAYADYIALPDEYYFTKPVMIRFYNSRIDPAHPENLTLYHYRTANEDETGAVDGYIRENIDNIEIYPGWVQFESNHFSAFGYDSDPSGLNRIVFHIPLSHLQSGAVTVRTSKDSDSTTASFDPGHVGIKSSRYGIIHSIISSDGLRESNLLDDFIGTGTYFGAYFLDVDDMLLYAQEAGKQASDKWENKDDYEYLGKWNIKNAVVCTTFVADCYEDAGVSIPWTYVFPKFWLRESQNTKFEARTSKGPVIIEVSYAYQRYNLFLSEDYHSQPATYAGPPLPKGITWSNGQLTVNPIEAEPGSYNLLFKGETDLGRHKREETLTVNVINDSGPPPPPLNFTVQPHPDDPTKVYANISAILDSGTPRTDLGYDNFSLEEDSMWRMEWSVELSSTSEVFAKADIAFVIDVTGSMDNEIAGVRDSVKAFADYLASLDTDIRVGGVPFRDDVGSPFDLTSDIDSFKTWVSGLTASGGDDTPENDLDAIVSAIENFAWLPGAQKILIVITDAPTHFKGDGSGFAQYTVQEVIDLLNSHAAALYSVSPGESYDGYPDVSEIAQATGGGTIIIPSSGIFDLNALGIADLISASYIMIWPDPDFGISNEHAVRIGVYLTPEDKIAGNQWRDYHDTFWY